MAILCHIAEPVLDDNFPVDNTNSASLKSKQKITGKTADGGKKDVEIMMPLKHLSNFWKELLKCL